MDTINLAHVQRSPHRLLCQSSAAEPKPMTPKKHVSVADVLFESRVSLNGSNLTALVLLRVLQV